MRWCWALGISSLLAAIVAGCRNFPTPNPTAAAPLPIRHSAVREQLVVYSDFPLPKDHRLLDELGAQRYDLAQKLALPITEEPIHVYLFNSPETFRSYMARHYPDFPARRAFFVETDTQLGIYAHWGDRVAEDLRHEVAHGYLHAAAPNLPLWLDEGLAEYFEVPRGNHGFHSAHLKELSTRQAAGTWRPDLRRLEALESAGDMEQLEYAESWAWVHMLLETSDERRQVLHEYLQGLRKDGAAPPLSLALRKVHGNPDEALAQYVGVQAAGNSMASAAPSPGQSP